MGRDQPDLPLAMIARLVRSGITIGVLAAGPVGHCLWTSSQARADGLETDLQEKDIPHWTLLPEAAISFPQPVEIGAEVSKLELPDWHAYLDGGFLQYPFTGGDRALGITTVETGLRWQPFHNWFVTSLGLGYRRVTFNASISALQIDGESVANGAHLDLTTFYLAPAIGASFHLARNLLFGCDAGIEYPLISYGSLNLIPNANSDPADLETDSQTAMGRLAGLVVPRITLFRLTWILE